MENSVKEAGAADVIVFSDCSLPVSLKHPEWYVYLFRDYKEIEETDAMRFNGSINYYKSREGFYATASNQQFAGKKKDVDRILQQFADAENTYIVFWRSEIGRTDADIQRFFSDTGIDITKPLQLAEFQSAWKGYFME